MRCSSIDKQALTTASINDDSRSLQQSQGSTHRCCEASTYKYRTVTNSNSKTCVALSRLTPSTTNSVVGLSSSYSQSFADSLNDSYRNRSGCSEADTSNKLFFSLSPTVKTERRLSEMALNRQGCWKNSAGYWVDNQGRWLVRPDAAARTQTERHNDATNNNRFSPKSAASRRLNSSSAEQHSGKNYSTTPCRSKNTSSATPHRSKNSSSATPRRSNKSSATPRRSNHSSSATPRNNKNSSATPRRSNNSSYATPGSRKNSSATPRSSRKKSSATPRRNNGSIAAGPCQINHSSPAKHRSGNYNGKNKHTDEKTVDSSQRTNSFRSYVKDSFISPVNKQSNSSGNKKRGYERSNDCSRDSGVNLSPTYSSDGRLSECDNRHYRTSDVSKANSHSNKKVLSPCERKLLPANAKFKYVDTFQQFRECDSYVTDGQGRHRGSGNAIVGGNDSDSYSSSNKQSKKHSHKDSSRRESRDSGYQSKHSKKNSKSKVSEFKALIDSSSSSMVLSPSFTSSRNMSCSGNNYSPKTLVAFSLREQSLSTHRRTER